MKTIALAALVLLAQIHPHRPSPPPLYIEPITISPRAVTDNEVTRIPPTHADVAPSPLAPVSETWIDSLPPYWPLIALLAGWLAYRVYRDRRQGLGLPDRSTLPPVVATHQDEAMPVLMARRSAEDCRSQYIDTVRAQVRAMIGRSDIRCEAVPGEPIEMRWRAWMQAADYQTAKPQHRAVGRSEGAALKGLLATHRAYGGDWIGFAVDRERVALEARAETAAEVSDLSTRKTAEAA